MHVGTECTLVFFISKQIIVISDPAWFLVENSYRSNTLSLDIGYLAAVKYNIHTVVKKWPKPWRYIFLLVFSYSIICTSTVCFNVWISVIRHFTWFYCKTLKGVHLYLQCIGISVTTSSKSSRRSIRHPLRSFWSKKEVPSYLGARVSSQRSLGRDGCHQRKFKITISKSYRLCVLET